MKLKSNVVNLSDNLCPKCKSKVVSATTDYQDVLMTIVFCSKCYHTIDVIA